MSYDVQQRVRPARNPIGDRIDGGRADRTGGDNVEWRRLVAAQVAQAGGNDQGAGFAVQ
jgi:hypothetical protein